MTEQTTVPADPKRRLFDISEDLLQLEALIYSDECDGDITHPTAQKALDQWMERLNEELEDKVDGYVSWIRELQARHDARKARAEQLQSLAKVDGNNAAKLIDRLKRQLQTLGRTKVEIPDGPRVTVCKNGGQLPIETLVDDTTMWPDDFLIQKPKIDMAAVREYLDSLAEDEPREMVVEIPPDHPDDEAGAQQITLARMHNRGTNLRIKG